MATGRLGQHMDSVRGLTVAGALEHDKERAQIQALAMEGHRALGTLPRLNRATQKHAEVSSFTKGYQTMCLSRNFSKR